MARILLADLTKSLARVLSRREEVADRILNIFMMGDSTCVACLFSPSITIKNVLLRNIVVTVKQRVREILEMLPESTVQLCWIPGDTNSSDLVSKLFQDPFTQVNSNLFGMDQSVSELMILSISSWK